MQTLQTVNLMMSLGMYQPVDTLIRDYPYIVMHINVRDDEIFVVLGHNFIDEFRLIQLSQRLHVPFRRLLIINRLNNVNRFYLEYKGNIADGEPILCAHGSGFNIYV